MKPDMILFTIVMVLIGTGIFFTLYFFDKNPKIKKEFLAPAVAILTGRPYDSEGQKPIKWWQGLLFILLSIVFVKLMIMSRT